MDTDADRLAMIQACGGVTVQAQNGSFEAIFDRAYLAAFADPGLEGTAPSLVSRDSDVSLLKLRKGEPVTIGSQSYRIARIEPDGTGISTLVLKS